MNLLINDSVKDTLGQLIDQATDMEGGLIRVKNGVLIDGRLKNVTIRNEGEKPVVISALAHLEACSIETSYFLNEGSFSGQVSVLFDAELTETSTTTGTLQYGRRFVLGGPLADAKDLRILGLQQQNKAVAIEQSKPAAIEQTYIEPKLLEEAFVPRLSSVSAHSND
jgi:hypothetical protein